MIEISLKSSDLLYLSCAISEVTNPRAVIQIIPGVKEHKSRYNEFIMELNNNGFNVFISDIRGHGRSINGNYPLGYIDDYRKWWKIKILLMIFYVIGILVCQFICLEILLEQK